MSAPSTGSMPPPPPVHSGLGHVRAAVVFLVLALVATGVVYPAVVTGISELADPSVANGSLLRDPNGTVVGSSLIAQNTSAPYLFWERPSGTDYNTTLGVNTTPGPSDPYLGELLNETLSYMRLYGNFTVNATLPFWLVARRLRPSTPTSPPRRSSSRSRASPRTRTYRSSSSPGWSMPISRTRSSRSSGSRT